MRAAHKLFFIVAQHFRVKDSSLRFLEQMKIKNKNFFVIQEEEDYIEASLVFRTFEEEEYESPEESDDEEEE